MRWAEGGSCRHDAILRYFGDEAEALAGCGICDVCARLAEGGDLPQDAEAATLVVRKALSAVARVDGRYGLGAAVALLRGAPDERLSRSGLDRTPTFGALREHADEWLQRLLRRLVTAGYVDFAHAERPVVRLTLAGREVMHGRRPARVELPADTGSRLPAAPGRKVPARPRSAAPGDAALPAGDQRLLDALRAHRLGVARAHGVPPYVVAHDRTLRELALAKPRSPDALAAIYGMGPSRIARYGPALLALIREHVTA